MSSGTKVTFETVNVFVLFKFRLETQLRQREEELSKSKQEVCNNCYTLFFAVLTAFINFVSILMIIFTSLCFQSKTLLETINKEKKVIEEKLSSMQVSVLQSQTNANSEGIQED